MGANGNQPQEKCHRGHKLVEPNLKTCQNGGRRCRSCECALSVQHNRRVRQGVVMTDRQVQEYADWKFSTLRIPVPA
jgi:hypothetical protein